MGLGRAEETGGRVGAAAGARGCVRGALGHSPASHAVPEASANAGFLQALCFSLHLPLRVTFSSLSL